MNIKEKLNFLDQISTPHKVPATKKETPFEIDKVVYGKYINSTFIATYKVPIEEQHGSIALKQANDISQQYLAIAGKDERLIDFDVKKSLFFDTETTGLSGGSGTYIFLAGFGYFEDNFFIIKQFFLPDLPAESEMLKSIHELLSRFNNLVTFNGKSYDWPLLKDRFIINRIKNINKNPLHLDLLHASRRIWKNSLPDCSLTTIEKFKLNIQRSGDVPSFMIPQLYFNYLRDRDSRPLKPVFYHNKIDILSMVSLMIRLAQIHQEPLLQLNKNEELLSVANHYQNMKTWNKNIPILKKIIASEKNTFKKKEISIQLGLSLKKIGKFSEAEKVWLNLINDGQFRFEPYEELAKYYEHRSKDLNKAKQVVESALKNIDYLEQLRPDNQLLLYKSRLNHRLLRLHKKLKI